MPLRPPNQEHGSFDEAAQLLRNVLARRRALGHRHQDTISAVFDLASVQRMQRYDYCATLGRVARGRR